jgi:L-ascorbate metabolism protein UlaG (beta-lactamase superfamily)
MTAAVTAPMTLRVRYLGGPTAVLDYGRARFVTDPTFDVAGEYPVGDRLLTKTSDAVVAPDDVGRIDAVLLSHDQHPDNLDHGGRRFLQSVPVVLSTSAAQQRIGPPVRGLAPWESTAVGDVIVTAVPAQHGPDGCEPYTGPVTGFLLAADGLPAVYVSGDNASTAVVRAIAERVGAVPVALLFAGAARTALFDGAALTLTSAQAAQVSTLLQTEHVVPLHFEGWAHFSEGREHLRAAFDAAGDAGRLHLLDPGGTWEHPDM